MMVEVDLMQAAGAEWESVRKMQDGIASEANKRGAILGGLNE